MSLSLLIHCLTNENVHTETTNGQFTFFFPVLTDLLNFVNGSKSKRRGTNYRKKGALVKCWTTTCSQNSFKAPWHGRKGKLTESFSTFIGAKNIHNNNNLHNTDDQLPINHHAITMGLAL